MTPAFEGDPETPKVVLKEQWFTVPAKTMPRGKGEATSSRALMATILIRG